MSARVTVFDCFEFGADPCDRHTLTWAQLDENDPSETLCCMLCWCPRSECECAFPAPALHNDERAWRRSVL